jgi:hypothetical protein
MSSKLWKIAVMLVLLAAPATEAGGSASDDYQSTLRQYLIARHCELVTPDVMSGFRLKVMTFHGVGGVTPRDARDVREEVNSAVRRDWRNRGMGARDPRCRTQGRAAARAFVEYLHGED